MASWGRQLLLRIWPIQLAFPCRILFRSVLLSPMRSSTSLVTFSGHFIFSILLQRHIWMLSEYFRSNVLSAQVSEPYKTIFRIRHQTNFFPSSMFSLLVKSDIFLLMLHWQKKKNVKFVLLIYWTCPFPEARIKESSYINNSVLRYVMLTAPEELNLSSFSRTRSHVCGC